MKTLILFFLLIFFYGCNSKINTTCETKIKELRDSISIQSDSIKKLDHELFDNKIELFYNKIELDRYEYIFNELELDTFCKTKIENIRVE